MKNIILIFFLSLFFTNSYTQETIRVNENEKCATDIIHQRLLQTDSLYKHNFNEIKNLIANGNVAAPKAPILEVPVVFHVLHLGEQEGVGTNISQEQILNSLASMNDAYGGISPFNTSGVDMEIEFCLASQDPSGNATTGILRVDASGTSDYATNGLTTFGSNNEISIKALSKWSNTDYYNIWIVSEINGNNAGGGTQGFAYFPGSSSSVDGTVILHNSIGYDPTGSRCFNVKSYTNYNITLIHELGHAFGLYHTFQGDISGTTCPTNINCNTDGDEICDTPPHERSSGCPTGTNNLCGTLRDNHIHNFLDYSSDICQTEFTAGQKTRARFFLSGARASLLTSSGCTPVAVPSSDFTAECSSVSGCVGSSINFYDLSTHDPNSWSWSFTGGTPNSSTAKNPVISYSASGTYSVSLQSTNSFGAGTTKTNTGYITIYDIPTAACTPGIQNSGNYGYSFSNVTFDDINNTTASSNNGFNDFSCDQVSIITEGQAYTLSITVGNSGGQAGFYDCFIDYNDDGVFSASESVLNGMTTAGSGFQTFSQSITIPTNAVEEDLLRMRVINDQFNLSGPCDNLFTGEAEDYGIYIAPISSTLPVDLRIFKGEHKLKFNEIIWITETEINNDYFILQSSIDGINFKDIFKINGKGNSTSSNKYIYEHYDPKNIEYYRYKQVDFDGQFSYSNIISVSSMNSTSKNLVIYPNPFSEKIIIKLDYPNSFKSIRVFNAMGKEVKSVYSLDFDEIEMKIDGPAGLYFIETTTIENKRLIQKIIKH